MFLHILVERLHFGCRLLSRIVLPKLIPGIRKDLSDWKSSSRLATLRLLSSLVLLVEGRVVEHLQDVMQMLVSALDDPCEFVVQEVRSLQNLPFF